MLLASDKGLQVLLDLIRDKGYINQASPSAV